MSGFTRLSVAANNISSLSNTPNKTDGKSGEQLRQLFDKTGADIKAYINGVLLAELEATGAAGNLGIAAITGMTAANVQDALEELYADIQEAVQSEIPDESVTTAKLNDEAVTTPKIADEAVTYAKTSGVQKQHGTATASIPAISAGGTQTVAVAGVTANNTVLVKPAPASFVKWRDCGVRCSAQGAGTLTFMAESSTGETLTANVLILD